MTPIYVPEGVSVSAGEILDDVNMRLDNDLEPKSAEFSGDGIAEVLHLPDRSLCDSDGLEPLVYTQAAAAQTVLVEGSDYRVDYQAGYVTLLTDHVDEGTTLYVDYKVRHWSDQLLWRLLGNGLQSLFPKFYAIAELTPTQDENGDYPLRDTIDRHIAGILDVEDVDSTATYHLSPQRDYRILRGSGDEATLRCFAAVNGTLTVRAAVRPASFLLPSSTLTDLGLPDRMREPLTLYVCWQAVMQKMPARSRWDNISALNTEGKTTFFDHARMVALFKALLDTELQSNSMRPWTSRGL